MLLGAYRQPDTALDADRPVDSAAVDRRPGAARSRQYRHHPADRRRRRRRRADPDRRQRRPLFGRGGARLDGRGVHPGHRDRAWERVPAVAARRARASWSAPASRRPTTISNADYAPPCFLLIGNEQQGLPRPTRPSATCSSKSPWRAAPTASTRRWRPRSWRSQIKASWRPSGTGRAVQGYSGHETLFASVAPLALAAASRRRLSPPLTPQPAGRGLSRGRDRADSGGLTIDERQIDHVHGGTDVSSRASSRRPRSIIGFAGEDLPDAADST